MKLQQRKSGETLTSEDGAWSETNPLCWNGGQRNDIQSADGLLISTPQEHQPVVLVLVDWDHFQSGHCLHSGSQFKLMLLAVAFRRPSIELHWVLDLYERAEQVTQETNPPKEEVSTKSCLMDYRLRKVLDEAVNRSPKRWMMKSTGTSLFLKPTYSHNAVSFFLRWWWNKDVSHLFRLYVR